MKPDYVIAVDGCYLPEAKVGAWACQISDSRTGRHTELVHSFRAGSALHAELLAVFKALSVLPVPSTVHLNTDCSGVYSVYRKYKAWSADGMFPKWVAGYGQLVPDLVRLLGVHHVQVQWLYGHAKTKGNRRCDRLAYKSAEAFARRLAVVQEAPSVVPLRHRVAQYWAMLWSKWPAAPPFALMAGALAGAIARMRVR